jgi:hypothetical protein
VHYQNCKLIKKQQTILSLSQIQIIKTVLYFDVFNYPLKVQELFENTAATISEEDLKLELEELVADHILFKEKEYISCRSSFELAIAKREKGNKGANEIMPIALRYSKIIASFPFVEGVFLSGALSKKYYDEKGDIDFFIVAKPGRLWLCRTFLIIRYKLLPASKKKYWCTNYFVSSQNLVIPEENKFTSTELTYLIPTVNYKLYQQLLRHNSWTSNFYPNKTLAHSKNCIDLPNPLLKRGVEFCLSGLIGARCEAALLRLTLNRWRKKFPYLSNEQFDLQYRSRKDACKRHTHNYQNKVLKLWQEKCSAFEMELYSKGIKEVLSNTSQQY